MTVSVGVVSVVSCRVRRGVACGSCVRAGVSDSVRLRLRGSQAAGCGSGWRAGDICGALALGGRARTSVAGARASVGCNRCEVREEGDMCEG